MKEFDGIKLPDNAELIDGKWWTPRMVMHFWGYTRATYRTKAEGKTLRQMLYASHLRAQVGERTVVDRSHEFFINERRFTVAMAFYYMIRYRYLDPATTSYKSFRGACGSYKTRTGSKNVLESVELNCMRYGCNIRRIFAKMTKEEYDKMLENYQPYINKFKPKAHNELPQHFNPNDRYIECLSADPRMSALYYKEVVERLPVVEKELSHYKETAMSQASTILSLKNEISSLEKELAKMFHKVQEYERERFTSYGERAETNEVQENF